MRVGRLVTITGLILVLLGAMGLNPLSTYQGYTEFIETYRGIEIWYNPDNDRYYCNPKVGWEIFAISLSAARAYIDEAFGSTPPSVLPTGYWTINGQQVSMTGTITVATKTINIAFICTKDASYVTSTTAKVFAAGTQILSTTLTLGASNTWNGVFTLPSDGTYTIEGYILTGGQTVRMLSIIANTGVVVSGITLSMWAGLGLMVVGLFMEWKEKKKE